MNTVVLDVRSLSETFADASSAMDAGCGETEARISFSAPELLWQVLTSKTLGTAQDPLRSRTPVHA